MESFITYLLLAETTTPKRICIDRKVPLFVLSMKH